MVDPKSFTDEVLLAAGGILARQTPKGAQIALIHRPKYGDWCLPKGKIEDNETIREAALREVREETHCEAIITGFADTTSYVKNDTPKVVYFWNMVLTKELPFKGTSEVDQFLWLPPRKAIRKLTHAEERGVVAEQFQMIRRRGRFRRRFLNFIQSEDIRARRLRGSIETFAVELARKKQKKIAEGKNEDVKWLASAEENLRGAEAALVTDDVDRGWRRYHAARAMDVFAMDTDELKSEATAIASEAGKISREWRKEAIKNMLSDDPKPPGALQVFKAMSLLNGHFNNIYHKIGLFRRQLTILAFVLLVVMAAIVIMASLKYIPGIGKLGEVESRTVIGVIIFGLLGGTVSSVFSFFKTPKSTTIMDTIATGSTTILRILVGAASALIIYVLARSSIFSDIFSFSVGDDATIFFLAFAAGYSERLVKRAVGHLAESNEQ